MNTNDPGRAGWTRRITDLLNKNIENGATAEEEKSAVQLAYQLTRQHRLDIGEFKVRLAAHRAICRPATDSSYLSQRRRPHSRRKAGMAPSGAARLRAPSEAEQTDASAPRARADSTGWSSYAGNLPDGNYELPPLWRSETEQELERADHGAGEEAAAMTGTRPRQPVIAWVRLARRARVRL